MGDAGSVDKLARSADLNKINNSGTNDDWFGNQRDQDQDPDQDQVSDLGSGEGGSGGGHDTGKSSSSRPTLVLVPRPAGPTTVPELVALLAVGRVYDAAQHEVALAAALDRCGKSGVTAADVDLLRDAFRHGWSPPVDRADPVAWWSFGDRLYRAFLAARARKADLDQKRQWAREAGLSP